MLFRSLDDPPHVLATGGGAFIDPQIRERIKQSCISVWLYADLDLLVRRVSRRNNRPLLKQGSPRDVLASLMERRYPIYAEADLRVDSADGPPEQTVQRVADALQRHTRNALSGAGASS